MTEMTGEAAELAEEGSYSRVKLLRRLEKSPRSQRVEIISRNVSDLIGQGCQVWLTELAALAEEVRLTVPELRALTSDLSWASREAGEDIPTESIKPVEFVDLDLLRLITIYTRGQRFRFDFRFRLLHESAHIWLREHDDALIRAFGAFAAFGLREPDGRHMYMQSVEAVDADQVSRHVCLDGLWIGYYLPDQPQLILALSGDMIGRGEAGGNLYFRRARAFSRLGETEKALADVYRAMDMLGCGNNAIHQDYVREWQIIEARADLEKAGDDLAQRLATELRSRADKHIHKAIQDMEERVRSAERLVGDGLLKVVEILGLFVTLAGFAVGGGFAMMKTQTWWQIVVTIVLIGLGSLAFFALLRIVMRFRRE
ncbi:hypothetical protein MF672_050690 (plasmid) [Actinomadura sp. ATCC 31491]|uniref:Tetratricopeptide repeat protein n=1 Tax=Actinomadura luzonensis TaxID=2805427 RepID=A0ABT0FSJ9_9ACTN|nr:hypothetical protein [Actinomadura luzonensis]MCK2215249.1 hypothetical protein [Actinomadura luzonensis]MCK2222023.1 hypothetical protein [Actinomadura luzonensis]